MHTVKSTVSCRTRHTFQYGRPENAPAIAQSIYLAYEDVTYIYHHVFLTGGGTSSPLGRFGEGPTTRKLSVERRR